MSEKSTEARPLSVQTIDSKGNAPKRRMATATAAWSAYTTIRQQNVKRDARFADIAGIYAGFPPTPPQVNANNGMPDMPNINLKQFQAKVEKYVATWNAVSSQSSGWFQVTAKHDEPMEAQRRSALLSEFFNDAIRQWEDSVEGEDFCAQAQYLLHSGVRDTQMGLFGIGVGLWEDKIDFRWTPISTRRVLVPQGTRIGMGNCPAMFIEDNNFSVAQLWNMRKRKGWNENAINRALYDRVELQAQTQQRSWTFSEWVNKVRDNDAAYLYDFAPVRVVHVFTQEFDMTISHSIFCDFTYTNGDGKNYEGSKKEKEYEDAANSFLFDETNVAKRWQQVVGVFADNAGPEGDWHGVKGFGDKIFDGCHLNNLTFNRAATGAFVANTLMFKGLSESDIQKLDQIVITNMGILPVGLELEQQRFAGDINGALEIFNASTNVIDSNSRDFPQNQRTSGGEQPTATQVNADRADEAQFDNLQVETYRVFLDAMGSEMYRRLAQPGSKYPESWGGGKIAKCFRERCKEAGIPEGEMLMVKRVRANRNGSSGNMSLDIMKADIALSVATPGKGQENARRAKVAAVWGPENVDAFIESAPQPAPDDQWIDNDNLMMQEGQVPQPFGWQDQEKHVKSHLQLGAQSAEVAQNLMETQGAVDQNLDAADKLSNVLLSVAQHVGAHIALMQQMPRINNKPTLYEKLVEEAAKQAHNLQEMGQALAEDVAKARQAQSPQMSPEMAKAQAQIRIDNAKAQAEIARRDAAAQSKLGHMAVQNEARTQMKIQDHALKVDSSAAKTEQELQQSAARNVQEMVQSAAQHHQEVRHEEQSAAVKRQPKKKEKPSAK